MKKTKVYIAGKITGLSPEQAEANFLKAQLAIEELGFEAVNPYEEGKKLKDKSYESYIISGLKLLSTCDAIYFLENWKDSKGALLEEHYARLCKKIIFFEGNSLQGDEK